MLFQMVMIHARFAIRRTELGTIKKQNTLQVNHGRRRDPAPFFVPNYWEI